MTDIINLPYPNPEIEADFPAKVNRAAQFAPFAALTGHGDAVKETARLTQRRVELDEYEKEEINFKLIEMQENPQNVYSITYFVPDKFKDGGEYVTATGSLSKIDTYEKTIILNDKREISINEILIIEKQN